MSPLFSHFRCAILTAILPAAPTLLQKFGGRATRAATAADADLYNIALAEPEVIAQVDPQLLAAFAGRIYRAQLITDSVRRKKVQDLALYLIDVKPAASSPPLPTPPAASASTPGVYSHQLTSVIAHSSVTAAADASAALSAAASAVAAPLARSPLRGAAASKRAPSALASPTSTPESMPPLSDGKGGSRKRSLQSIVDGAAAERAGLLSPGEGQPLSASKRFRALSPRTFEGKSDESVGALSQKGTKGAASAAAAAAIATTSPAAATSVPVDSYTRRMVAQLKRNRRSSAEKKSPEEQQDVDMTDAAAASSSKDSSVIIPASEELPEQQDDEESKQMDLTMDSTPPTAGDRSSRIHSACAHLEREGVPRPLILHALLVCSGSFQASRAYLLGLPPADTMHVWTPVEDRLVTRGEEERSPKQRRERKRLVEKVGKEEVQKRVEFLASAGQQ